MAPNLRTYSRKKPDQRNSVDVVNALFVTNLYLLKTESSKPKGTRKTKGVKRGVQVDSAPPTNSSPLDPFDKILRSKNYNDILYKRTLIDKSTTEAKEATLDRPVDESLEIESVQRRQVADDTLNITPSLVDDNSTTTSACANPNSNLNGEQSDNLDASACMRQCFVDLTPIKINKFPINQSALDESLKEIEEWNYKLPVFKDYKKPTKRKPGRRGVKKSIQKAKDKTDWKLKSIPKVIIDKINIKNSSCEKKTKRENLITSINVSLDEFEKFYKSISENSIIPIVESDSRSEDGCLQDSRFITKRVLRKRANTTVDNLNTINKKIKISDNISPNKSNLNDTSIQNNFGVLHGRASNIANLITSTPYINKEDKRVLRKRSITVDTSSNLSQDSSNCRILRSGKILDNSSILSNTSNNKNAKGERKSKSLKPELADEAEKNTKSYLTHTKSMSCLEGICVSEKPENGRKTYQNSSDNLQTHSMSRRSRSTCRESKQNENSHPKQRLRRSKSFYFDTSKSSQTDDSNSRIPELPSTSNTSEKSDKQFKPYFLRKFVYNVEDISDTEKTQNDTDSLQTSLICGRPRTKNRDPRKHVCSFSSQRLIRSKSLYLDTANTVESDNLDASECRRQCFVDLTSIVCEKSYDFRTKSMSYLDITGTGRTRYLSKTDLASDQETSLKMLPLRRRPRTMNRESRKSEPIKPRLRRSKSFYIDTSACDYSSTSMVMRSGRVLPNTLITPDRLNEIIGINNLTDSNIVKDSLSNIQRNSISAIEEEPRNINNLSNSNLESSLRQNNFFRSDNLVINPMINYGVSDKINVKGENITVRRKPNVEILQNVYLDFQQSTEDSSITTHGDQTNLGQTQNCTRSSENLNNISKSMLDYESNENLLSSSGEFAVSTTTMELTENNSLNKDKTNVTQNQSCLELSECRNDFSKRMFDYETDETSGLEIPTSTTKQTENTSLSSIKNIKIIDICSLPKDRINTPDVSAIEKSFVTPLSSQKIYKNVKTGKEWRRSLAYRKKTMLESVCQRVVCSETNNCACPKCIHIKLLDQSVCRKSVRVVLDGTFQGETRRISLIETYANATTNGYVPENFVREAALGKLFEDLSVSQNVTRHQREGDAKKEFFVSARDIVLRRCQQTEVVPFEECYPPSVLKNCHKIGEGVYGEVFLFRNKTGSTSVMKVIPIEGDLIVNGERQKKYEEILSEIVIAMELSNLRSNKKNNTAGFSEVRNVHCVQGKYPEQLLDLWNLYDEDRGSENECPDIFDEKQLYIILELANGGKDLESFVFANAKQAYSLFKQAACSLAVAEVGLQFEHRDLHWGNILISPVDKNKEDTYVINGREIRVPSNGVQISIIDFTLSRINFDGVCIYNDLSLDPDLFNADGDYQFEIYRLMQKRNGNNWQPFEPYTNILWLHYTLDKMIDALRYKPRLAKCHPVYIDKMKELKEQILEYKSVEEFVTHTFV